MKVVKTLAIGFACLVGISSLVFSQDDENEALVTMMQNDPQAFLEALRTGYTELLNAYFPLEEADADHPFTAKARMLVSTGSSTVQAFDQALMKCDDQQCKDLWFGLGSERAQRFTAEMEDLKRIAGDMVWNRVSTPDALVGPARDFAVALGAPTMFQDAAAAGDGQQRKAQPAQVQQPVRPQPKPGIRYEREAVNGLVYDVGHSSKYTVWCRAVKRNTTGTKLLAEVFVVNNSTAKVLFEPADIEVEFTTKSGKKERGYTFTSAEWVHKQENKAAWQAALTGFAVGVANSGPTSTTYGTYNGNYGGTNYYGTYTGTTYDRVAASANAQRQAEQWGAIIADAFAQRTNSLATLDTVYPDEIQGGKVFFKKGPASAIGVRFVVPLGGERFVFDYTY